MVKRVWLLFAQAVTVVLAVMFVLLTFRPGWLGARYAARSPVASDATLVGAGGASSVAPVSYASAAQRATPAVVNISTTKDVGVSTSPFADDPTFRKFFGDGHGTRHERASSLGSGVLVSSAGYILTNNHVVESADEIEVGLADGRKASGTLVGNDPDTDLAVLKIELPNLPAIAFGQSDRVHVGDVVLAIGNPFGFGSSVTMGIVSATGRNRLGINAFENFIQTDAAINPGNSGGALVDAQGNLLGINTAIYSRSGTSSGIGFAIPVSTAKTVLDSIVATGQVVRGYIGVETQDVTPELAEAFGLPRKDGAIIAGVLRGGPADKAGVRTGDVLVAVNDQAVADSTVMLNLVAQLKPGAHADLTVLRDHHERRISVEVGKRPKAVNPE